MGIGRREVVYRPSPRHCNRTYGQFETPWKGLKITPSSSQNMDRLKSLKKVCKLSPIPSLNYAGFIQHFGKNTLHPNSASHGLLCAKETRLNRAKATDLFLCCSSRRLGPLPVYTGQSLACVYLCLFLSFPPELRALLPSLSHRLNRLLFSCHHPKIMCLFWLISKGIIAYSHYLKRMWGNLSMKGVGRSKRKMIEVNK